MSSQPTSDLTALSLHQAAGLIRSREVSPLEITRTCINRILALDSQLHAFITLTAGIAMQQARQAEDEIAAGTYRGPLHGIPIALKDIIDTVGIRTTAASRVYEKRLPETDAAIVRRLRKSGAVIIGKTNLHEFAYGGSGMITAFGEIRNPVAPDHIAGGSSSGSAVAVATGMCYAAVGTDTAGSIRLPAAYCGIVGFKPTYGLVSTEGVVPLSWSLDHVGPMARTVQDTALLLHALTGNQFAIDEFDPKRSRVGVARRYFFDGLDPEVAHLVYSAIERLQSALGPIADVEFEVDEDRTVSKAEAFAYHQPLLATSSDQYQPETLRRIRTGENVLAAEYIRALRNLEQQRSRSSLAFADSDIVITPTCPIPAPTIAELRSDPDSLRARELLMLRNTRPFNVLGLPTVTLPCGHTSAGLPVGLQLTAASGNDALLLQFAQVYQHVIHSTSPA